MEKKFILKNHWLTCFDKTQNHLKEFHIEKEKKSSYL